MARTTLDIDGPVLDELKQVQRERGGTLGEIASQLLARALKDRKPSSRPRFSWTSRRMNARVDLADRDAIYAALDRADGQ